MGYCELAGNTVFQALTLLNVQNFKTVKNNPGTVENYRETTKAPDITKHNPGPYKNPIFA